MRCWPQPPLLRLSQQPPKQQTPQVLPQDFDCAFISEHKPSTTRKMQSSRFLKVMKGSHSAPYELARNNPAAGDNTRCYLLSKYGRCFKLELCGFAGNSLWMSGQGQQRHMEVVGHLGTRLCLTTGR